MKKNLVFLFASVVLSACGGTIEAEEPGTLQSTKQHVTYDTVCPASCANKCTAGGASGCGWYCGKRWSHAEWKWIYEMALWGCTTAPNYDVCGGISTEIQPPVRCATPCEVGAWTTQPCSST